MKKIIFCSLAVLLLTGCGSKSVQVDVKDNNQTQEANADKGSKKSERRKKTKSSSELVTEETTTTSTKETIAEISTELFLDASAEPVSYSSDEKGMTAYVPDFEHYSKEDAITILGEPAEILTDYEALANRLGLEGDEFARIKDEVLANKLTENQAKAFMAQSIDVKGAGAFGPELVGLIYDDPEKPNVYLLDGKVSYVTPIIAYMEFNGKLSQ